MLHVYVLSNDRTHYQYYGEAESTGQAIAMIASSHAPHVESKKIARGVMFREYLGANVSVNGEPYQIVA